MSVPMTVLSSSADQQSLLPDEDEEVQGKL